MKINAKIVNNLLSLIIFLVNSILNVCLDCEYTRGFQKFMN